jgi:hypothetical protein
MGVVIAWFCTSCKVYSKNRICRACGISSCMIDCIVEEENDTVSVILKSLMWTGVVSIVLFLLWVFIYHNMVK